MDRIRFILVGTVVGIAWAASLRGFMMVLAGPDSIFTFGGTFGVIIPSGMVVGALLGWAEHQRRTGHQHGLLILAPLVLGVAPLILTGGVDPAPFALALFAMVGGYSVSGRGPVWARVVAGTVALATIPVTWLAPKPDPDLSATTPYGAWFATLACSLFVTLALASSIPMLRPQTREGSAAATSASDVPGRAAPTRR
jgi:hypothetical protein